MEGGEFGGGVLGSFVDFADVVGVEFVGFVVVYAGDEGSLDHVGF